MKVYEARTDLDGKWYIDGPNMPGFYGGTLKPSSRFNNEEEAIKAANHCDLAYKEGYQKAQLDIRKSLGLHK